ncbi:hypothetical protein ACIBH1_48700 [Nonomuraea sp. NPDC050663]|uniref:hypothetical protein n=1 Tax=Nonomuraea sp. NPDC050663 TaxID=3364370 RepID=UPI0037AF9AB4
MSEQRGLTSAWRDQQPPDRRRQQQRQQRRRWARSLSLTQDERQAELDLLAELVARHPVEAARMVADAVAARLGGGR